MKYTITVFFLLIFSVVKGQSVLIGSDTLNTLYGPIYIFSATSTNTNSWNLAIYDQSEIINAGGHAGDFTGISWYKSNVESYLSADATFQVYLKHTSLSDFLNVGDFDVEVVGASLVYESMNQILPATIGWFDIPFSSNFTWNGTDNIMVLTHWARPGNASGTVNWQSTTTSVAKVSHSFNTDSTMGSLYTNPKRPNIKLEQSTSTLIPEGSGNSSFYVYPNPAKEILYVHKPFGEGLMQIFDYSGKLVISKLLSEEEVHPISLAGISKGIYKLNIVNKSSFQSTNFVVMY